LRLFVIMTVTRVRQGYSPSSFFAPLALLTRRTEKCDFESDRDRTRTHIIFAFISDQTEVLLRPAGVTTKRQRDFKF